MAFSVTRYVPLVFGTISSIAMDLIWRTHSLLLQVNVASRMESNSASRKIQCSERSAKLLAVQAPHIPLHKRGKIGVKGKGDMVTYWVGGGSKSKDKDGDKGEDDRPHVDFLADNEVLG
jgi:Adenylate and Guanylate cyclase catalytic domain